MHLNPRFVFGGLFSVLALPIVMAACSSTTGPIANVSDSGTNNEAGNEAGNDAASPSADAGADVTSVNPDPECAAEPSFSACGDCCSTKHDTGYVTFLQAMIDCVCKGEGTGGAGPCAAECADSFCKATPTQPSGTCDTCLQAKVGAGGVCAAPVAAKCNENADCTAYDACTVPCKAKP